MKTIVLLMLSAWLSIAAMAEVKYTAYNQPIPQNGLWIDFDFDEVQDVIIQSTVSQYECQGGDNWMWRLESLMPSVAVEFTGALREGTVISMQDQQFASNTILAEYANGSCGLVVEGEWYGRVNKFMGVKFHDSRHNLHYGWVQLSGTAELYDGYLHVTTYVSGWAYETVAGKPIRAGDRGNH